jgi:hypothetical protein
MMKRILSVFIMIFSSVALFAQDTLVSTDPRKNVFDTAVSIYHHFTDKQSRLYNGTEHIYYSPAMEGHGYFLDRETHAGSVIYDGVFYNNVQMQYDIIKDYLVILHFDRFFKMNLISDKVKEFSFAGHNFVRMVKDSTNDLPFATGFYDRLYNGNMILLAKHQKRIEETVTDRVVQRVVEKTFYYLYNGKNYQPVRSYKSLLGMLKDHSKEVRQYLRKNKIKYRKDREKAITKAVAYYDSLKK